MRKLVTTMAVAAALAAPATADAFCGFYVSGADAELYNNATMVVMMREGTRTVLSMQNNYQGPAKDFAMVVPVPVVLQKENVKTLPNEVFARVDKLAAPRLVEYWEQDPCAPMPPPSVAVSGAAPPRFARMKSAGGGGHGVTVEAQFEVGEYEIVILSAKDSGGLDAWLREQKYRIPKGAEPVLRPYVQQGMKFFVAKVNIEKVKREKGRVTLSPLRFHYDTDDFSLPVRLGLLNSKGEQDLLVHILAKGKRYEVANYDTVTIPTNLEVKNQVRQSFGRFYAALFDDTVKRHPRAVVTEYSWDASSCDPCPEPPLRGNELATLGADVVSGQGGASPPPPPGRPGGPPVMRRRRIPMPRGFVLTRLHARYAKDSLGHDLVFREAKPIVGGREFVHDGDELERGAREASMNNFQGRYIIRHPWKGAINCQNPRRGIWGGPPRGVQGSTQPKPALDLAFVKRDAKLPALLARGIDDDKDVLVSEGTLPDPPPEAAKSNPEEKAPMPDPAPATTAPPAESPSSGGCGSCTVGAAGGGALGAASAGLFGFLLWSRRRRR